MPKLRFRSKRAVKNGIQTISKTNSSNNNYYNAPLKNDKEYAILVQGHTSDVRKIFLLLYACYLFCLRVSFIFLKFINFYIF